MQSKSKCSPVCPEDVALAFKQLGVSSLVPPRPILSNVSGFVKRGGITASEYLKPPLHTKARY